MSDPKRLKSSRPRSPRDFYETPFGVIEAAANALNLMTWANNSLINTYIPSRRPMRILDAGMGRGRWGHVFKRFFGSHGITTELIGIDTHIEYCPPEYDEVYIQDYITWRAESKFDFVIGNPPFSLAEPFVRKSKELLHTFGVLQFLLPQPWSATQKRHRGIHTEWRSTHCLTLARRPSFFSTREKGKTTDMKEYAIFMWEKGANPSYTREQSLEWSYHALDRLPGPTPHEKHGWEPLYL